MRAELCCFPACANAGSRVDAAVVHARRCAAPTPGERHKLGGLQRRKQPQGLAGRQRAGLPVVGRAVRRRRARHCAVRCPPARRSAHAHRPCHPLTPGLRPGQRRLQRTGRPSSPCLLSSRARRQAARLHAVHGARGGDAAGRAGRPGPPDLARAQLQLAQRHAAGRVRGRLPRAGRAAPGLQRVHGQPAGRVAGHARRPAGAAVARAGGQPAGGRAAGRGARRAGQPAEPGPAVEPARGARPPAAPTRSSPAWEGWRQGSVAGRTRRAAARAARERRPSRPGPTGPALGQPPRTLGPGAAPGAGQAGCAAGLTI